jgi:hypothetical protein
MAPDGATAAVAGRGPEIFLRTAPPGRRHYGHC